MLKKQLFHLLFFILIIFPTGCSEYFSQHTREDSRLIYQEQSGSSEVGILKGEHTQDIPEQHIDFSRREKYLLDSNDVLNIIVFEDEDLSMTIRVSDEGKLNYPLVGNIQVKGLTTQEVETILEERLKDGYLTNPIVTVRLDIDLMKKYREKEVFVLGEVENPGAIPMLGKYMTALEAVTTAGGFTDIAAPNRTKIIRLEGGVEKTIRVNLNKVKKGDRGLDVILQPGDTIVVPETYF
ncbi:MAG: polysaccharide biosynthesis/export family protein [Candidatus Brocadiales bacterium]|nr:polysaccharide biosynthesis/export family protein [Candidatus Brocadiales bacterium]